MSHKIDLEGARAYVLAHSNELGKARLTGILEGARPPKELVKALEARQNPDGGFPRDWASAIGGPDPTTAPASSLDATCLLLDQIRDLPPLTGSPMASRALSYLRRAQNRDGAWFAEGAPSLEGEEGTAYRTANVTFTLLTLDPTNRDPINWGIKWLERYEGECGLQLAFLAWAAACRHVGLDSPLARRYWERARAASTETDLDWFLSTALNAGVGGRYLIELAHLLERFATRQQPDGGWPGDDRVHATLMALRVLRGFALI